LKSLTSVNLSDLDWPEVDDSRDGSLSKQVVNPNTTFKVNEDSVDITVLDEKGVRQETRAVSLMVEKWPEKFALWSTPDLFANIFFPDKGIQCPFLISFTMKGTDFHENRDLAQSNTRRCEKNNNAVQRFLNPNLVKEYEDWNNAYKATTTGDMSLIPTFYNIVLFTTEKSEAKHVAQTMSAFRQFNFELIGGYDRVGTLTTQEGCGEKLVWEESIGEYRYLTPLECERLQGFKDGWTEGISDNNRYYALGNAVNCNVSEYLFNDYLKDVWEDFK